MKTKRTITKSPIKQPFSCKFCFRLNQRFRSRSPIPIRHTNDMQTLSIFSLKANHHWFPFQSHLPDAKAILRWRISLRHAIFDWFPDAIVQAYWRFVIAFDVPDIANRVYSMKLGKIGFEGAPEELCGDKAKLIYCSPLRDGAKYGSIS